MLTLIKIKMNEIIDKISGYSFMLELNFWQELLILLLEHLRDIAKNAKIYRNM